MAELNQSPNHYPVMHSHPKGHNICPYCRELFTTPQALGSHQRIHKNKDQVEASGEGSVVVLALPAPMAEKRVTNQQALDYVQIAEEKEIQEIGKPCKVATEGDEEEHLPRLMDLTNGEHHGEKRSNFANRMTNSEVKELRKTKQARKETNVSTDLALNLGFTKSVSDRSREVEELDIENSFPKTHKSEDSRPCFIDFMNNLEQGKEVRQAEREQKEPELNTELTLKLEGVDLTLRL